MPTTTRTPRRSSAATTTGRFTRSTSAGQRGTASRRRPAVSQRRGLTGGWLQRRQPQKSRLDRALGGLSGALPGRSKRRSKTSSSKSGRRGVVGGGLALVAGAAGLLFKNRDKVVSRTRRGGGTEPAA